LNQKPLKRDTTDYHASSGPSRGYFWLAIPPVDPVAQHTQRQRACIQHLVVESPRFEFVEQRFPWPIGFKDRQKELNWGLIRFKMSRFSMFLSGSNQTFSQTYSRTDLSFEFCSLIKRQNSLICRFIRLQNNTAGRDSK
jgi:hypothetical protein